MTTVRFAPFPSCVGGALAGFPMWIHARAFVHPHFPPPYPARRALTCQNRQMSVGGERGRRHARAYELMIVYEAQGYTPLLFATALSHIGHKFSETLWLAIARFIYDIRSTP